MLIGYARVSKADGSQSLDLQRDVLIEAGVKKGQIYSDLASGIKDDRTGLEACLKALREGDVLVVWRLDRMGRNLHHLVRTVSMLSERGVGLKVLTGQGTLIDTTTAAGHLSFGIFAALAEFERELIRERTMAGLKSARRPWPERWKEICSYKSASPHGTGCHGQSRYVGFRTLQRTRGNTGHALPVCRPQWQSTRSRETSS